MSLIGNLIWFVFGGIFMGLGWWLAGLLMFVSIVGIPWAAVFRDRQLLVLSVR